MGSLAIQEVSGHIGIQWDDSTIKIDMDPKEGKSTREERELILGIVEQCLIDHFVVTVNDRPASLDQCRKANQISVSLPKPSIKEILGKVIKAPIFANHLLFHIGKNGEGELIQKSKFTVDDGKYQTVPPQKGG